MDDFVSTASRVAGAVQQLNLSWANATLLVAAIVLGFVGNVGVLASRGPTLFRGISSLAFLAASGIAAAAFVLVVAVNANLIEFPSATPSISSPAVDEESREGVLYQAGENYSETPAPEQP
ncbi:MAG: hypothetical protein AB7J28_13985 [Hyphomonadaceae bacterium]